MTLSVITGGVAGLALERLLLPGQTGAARRVTRRQRLAVAVGYRGDRRHFPPVGRDPIDCCWRPCRCECWRQDVVVSRCRAKSGSRRLASWWWAVGLAAGGSPLLWSVLAGVVVLALLCGLVGWGIAVAAPNA